MRQCEYKRRYDPEIGQYVKEHIYGEGVFDSIRSFGSKLFGKAAKKAASKASEHAEEKAGDKIVQLLGKKKKTKRLKHHQCYQYRQLKKINREAVVRFMRELIDC